VDIYLYAQMCMCHGRGVLQIYGSVILTEKLAPWKRIPLEKLRIS
jgi:hypothetical protein